MGSRAQSAPPCLRPVPWWPEFRLWRVNKKRLTHFEKGCLTTTATPTPPPTALVVEFTTLEVRRRRYGPSTSSTHGSLPSLICSLMRKLSLILHSGLSCSPL